MLSSESDGVKERDLSHHVDIVQVDKTWLKGRLQIAVLDESDNIVCICGEDDKMAQRIANLLELEKMIEDYVKDES
jgi:hypothetical protein